MEALVGYTGFVGSNLAASHRFGRMFNSSDIQDAFGLKPDLLVYSGLRAEKFIANKFPEKDRRGVEGALDNIIRIAPKSLVLISTIDVYDNPVEVDESSPINKEALKPYGLNRLWLEEMAPKHVKECLIVRLPGLYGRNLKKNFIFDMLNRTPRLLTEKKLDELEGRAGGIKERYELDENGFFKLKALTQGQMVELEAMFERAGFSSLNFTDSRASFQFYDLSFLWGHIALALEKGLGLVNMATEPLKADELFEHVFGKGFLNILDGSPAKYDFRTLHDEALGGEGGYLFDKGYVKEGIREFVLGALNK